MIKLFKRFNIIDIIIIIIIIFLIIVQVQFDLALPDYMGDIIVLIQMGSTVNQIIDVGLKMILVTLGSGLSVVIIGFLAAWVAARLARKVRRELFNKVNSFSMEEMNKFSTSSLITRSTNDITQVQQVTMMMLRLLITAPAIAIGAILKIVNKNLTLTYVTGGSIVLLFLLITFMFFVVVPKFKLLQKQIDKINLVTRENLTGLKVVRAYNAEYIESEKFEGANKDLTKTQLFVNRAMSIMMPGMNLIMSALSLAIVWVGAYLINSGDVSLENMFVFTQYSMQILFSFMMLFMLFVMLPRASVSAKRINEILHQKVTIKDGDGTNVDDDELGTIEFKDVDFRYPEADSNVLENINLKINKGETVAFIGSTGSGKSTLVNLIPRFYDVTNGAVYVNGKDVREYKLIDLYNYIGYVPQKGVLFSGTVLDNIKYGDDNLSEEEVQKAIEIAQANFVNEFEDKTNHYISQGGKNVSGGQKQRLSIARAIVKKPDIYIFDDSFSALDYKTDKQLRNALKKETKGSTILIVAQRIGSIIEADKIVVLNQGRIVGIGTHKDLLSNCEVYQEIAYSQLSKEEL